MRASHHNVGYSFYGTCDEAHLLMPPRRRPLVSVSSALCPQTTRLRIVRQEYGAVHDRLVASAVDGALHVPPISSKQRPPDYRGSPCLLSGPCHSARNSRCNSTENGSRTCRCNNPRSSPMSGPRAITRSSHRNGAWARCCTCALSRVRPSHRNSRRSGCRNSRRTCARTGLCNRTRSYRRRSVRSIPCNRLTNGRRASSCTARRPAADRVRSPTPGWSVEQRGRLV
jgi:hypothetical protein